jgi:uncharacterized membrane protein
VSEEGNLHSNDALPLSDEQLVAISEITNKPIDELRKNLDRTPEEIIQRVFMQGKVQQYSMPVPPADVLSELDLVIPGLAERIVTMVEQRTEVTNEERRANIRIAERDSKLPEKGLYVGAAIILTILGLTVYLVENDQDIAAGLAALSGLLLVAVKIITSTMGGKSNDSSS